MTDPTGFNWWEPLLLAIATGSGGGLFGAWLQHNRETKSTKSHLRKIVDEAAGGMISNLQTEGQQLRAENRAIRERLDRLEERNEHLVSELAATHRNLRTTEEKLLNAQRKLMTAEQERDRKERVILQLQEQIHSLENTIKELRAQVDQLTQALAECAKGEHSGG